MNIILFIYKFLINFSIKLIHSKFNTYFNKNNLKNIKFEKNKKQWALEEFL